MSERYGFSLTTFSPSGKLVQIEYALNAVNAGSPAVGIKASNGVVLATEKKSKSLLHDDRTLHKVETVCKNIGVVYSGMGSGLQVSTFVHSSTYFIDFFQITRTKIT